MILRFKKNWINALHCTFNNIRYRIIRKRLDTFLVFINILFICGIVALWWRFSLVGNQQKDKYESQLNHISTVLFGKRLHSVIVLFTYGYNPKSCLKEKDPQLISVSHLIHPIYKAETGSPREDQSFQWVKQAFQQFNFFSFFFRF